MFADNFLSEPMYTGGLARILIILFTRHFTATNLYSNYNYIIILRTEMFISHNFLSIYTFNYYTLHRVRFNYSTLFPYTSYVNNKHR